MSVDGFTDRVRQELSRAPLGRAGEQHAELAALLRLAGSLHLIGAADGNHVAIEVETTSGAVARRVHRLLAAAALPRPELRVRAPGGVRTRTTYGLWLDDVSDLAVTLGLLDADGRPVRELNEGLVGSRGTATAYLRGAFLATGSVSRPDRPPHLEIVVASDQVARALATIVRKVVDGHVAVADAPVGSRVTVKSGRSISDLLAALGVTNAFLEWEEQRLRRSLRGEATRLANADAANVRRTIEAARVQTQAVERAIDRLGWDGLDEDLRSVALARLANPEASLSELGELCDPPVGKSAVYRRLRRLEAIAAEADHQA